MAFWQQFFHIVWATKNREHSITAQMEPDLHRVLMGKCQDVGALGIVANGMPDHIHVVVAIPPTLCTADLVKNLKGTSSRFIHTQFEIPFEWQAGYGTFTISTRTLDRAVDYVNRQKEHHAAGTTVAPLERFSVEDIGPNPIHFPQIGMNPSSISMDD